VLVTVTAVGLLSASVASASFHLMNIRQVFGGNGNAANDYVELQMRSTGENFTGGHPIQVYNAVGLPQSAHPLQCRERRRPVDDPDRGHGRRERLRRGPGRGRPRPRGE
jgi:hypothetical protein